MANQETVSTSRVREVYEQAYQEHGYSLKSLYMPKGRQAERFAALTAVIPGDGFSILDYGCGFAHLKDYLDTRFQNVRYTGVDIVPDFIRESQARLGDRPDCEFRAIDSFRDVRDEYDYVLCAGVFNYLNFDTEEEHQQFVFETLRHLFGQTRKALIVDFMPADVDFRQPQAYHQDVTAMYNFVRTQLTRRLKLDCSYMPYEFCIVAYQDQEVLRPDNIYRPL